MPLALYRSTHTMVENGISSETLAIIAPVSLFELISAGGFLLLSVYLGTRGTLCRIGVVHTE